MKPFSKNNLPPAFENQLLELLGKEAFQDFKSALQKEPGTSIRLNPKKQAHLDFTGTSVPWAKDGLFLEERPSFTLDPLFHAGAYYVQEASSMFIQHILYTLQPPKNGVFLDLCAAPGGKSTILGTYLGQQGLLVSNEVIKTRASILKENLIKWGLGNAIVTQNDPDHFSQLAGFFDLVLVDAPCSGEGMFRKDPTAVTEWSLDLVSLCSHRQARILDQTGVLVKGGGYLIYSTCTFNDQENEAKVRMLAEEFSFQPVRIPLNADWGIEESRIETADGNFFGYRFYPHKVKGEGFFIAVLKRPEDCFQLTAKKAKDFKHPFIKPVSMEMATAISKLLLWEEKAFFYQLQGSYFWFNPDFQVQFEFLTQFLNIRYFGVELGKPNKDQWIPSHEWALSLLSKNGFKTLEVGLEDALLYLRKEDRFFENCPEGWVLITFRSLPLGWVKNLGNRLNNYYPKDWRVRKA